MIDVSDGGDVFQRQLFGGAADIEDDGIAFETKMRELSQTLFQQMNQAEALDKAIRQNLEALGYGE